jgi:hypothetical protein
MEDNKAGKLNQLQLVRLFKDLNRYRAQENCFSLLSGKIRKAAINLFKQLIVNIHFSQDQK